MNRKETLKKVLSYLGHYRTYLFASIVLSIVTVAFTLYIPKLSGKAIDVMLSKGNVDWTAVMHIVTQIIIFTILTSVATWVMNTLNNKMTYEVVKDIRQSAFDKMMHLPIAYIDSHGHGEMVSKMISDVDQFADGLLMGFTQFFTGVTTILGTLLFMLSMNFKITLVVVLVTPLSFAVASFIASRTYKMFSLQSSIRGEQTNLINEMISGQKTVQAFGMQQKVMQRFDDINERLTKASLQATFFSSLTNPATRFVNSVVYAGVGFTGALSVMRGYMSVGQLSSFLSYANQYTKPFNEISGVVTELQNALACAGRIFELIEAPSQLPDAKDATVLEDSQGNVVMDDVSFSYKKDVPLLKHLNLFATTGQRIAIVGPTGCGKTTLINLLMRFYDVNEGIISIDGQDIRKMTRYSLRHNFGMVLQETWLKSGTIKENLKMANPDASDEAIIQAAKACHAHGFIRRLPQGYDTLIDENGGALSQGQKQLLCITRVMLSKPSMLILDEATSSIDTRTEILVNRAFDALMEGKTSFIVAHRLSTIMSADCIVVMKDGEIIEMGKHDELLAKKGFYSDLYQSQYQM